MKKILSILALLLAALMCSAVMPAGAVANRKTSNVTAIYGGISVNDQSGINHVSSNDADIPSNAVTWNGHSYYCYNEIYSWDQAVDFCQSKGGYIATISSQDENDFLYDYICSMGYSSAYFGLTDEEKEGTWIWVNGEESAYRNWHSGEPNSESSAEDYAMFYWKFTDGTWNDGAFNSGSTVSDTSVFICEWGAFESSECEGGHSWTIDIENTDFVCSVCGKHQEISPVIGYEFGNDNFSFTNADVASYDISLPGYWCMNPALKLDIASLLANGILKLANYIATGNTFGGSCFGIAAMNSSFFYGMPTDDFGASTTSSLSIKNAESFFPNNDTKLKDAINIMFLSQSSTGVALFQQIQDGALFGDNNYKDFVDLAKGLKSGDYPPIVSFEVSQGGHAVNIIGIEPDDFLEESYCITTYDSNCSYFPSFFLVKKDYSEASFYYYSKDGLMCNSVKSINSFITSPSFNIDYWAPGLRNSPLYHSSKKETSIHLFDEENRSIPIAEYVATEESTISFIIPDDITVTITTPSGKDVIIDSYGKLSSELDSVQMVPFVGTSLLKLLLPYEDGEYLVSFENPFFININYNHNSATLYAESGGEIIYSAEGVLNYTPQTQNTYTEVAYYRYQIVGDSDVIGVETKGYVSSCLSLICEDESVKLTGGDISSQLLNVQHNDYEMTCETLSEGFGDDVDSVTISNSDNGIIVTPSDGGTPIIIHGDADGNGIVNTTDALLVLRCALGISGNTQIILESCDMNGDGVISTADALIILRLSI